MCFLSYRYYPLHPVATGIFLIQPGRPDTYRARAGSYFCHPLAAENDIQTFLIPGIS